MTRHTEVVTLANEDRVLNDYAATRENATGRVVNELGVHEHHVGAAPPHAVVAVLE